MTAIDSLHNRIDLVHVPFTDRGSRMMMFRRDDELYIRLAERWTQWETEYGHYRKRAPIVDNFAFVDGDGVPLALAADTYPHVIRLDSRVGRFDWAFLDVETLLVRLPAGRYGFRFIAQAETGQADRRGGTLHDKRHLAYTTDAMLIRNKIEFLADKRAQVEVQLDADDGDCLLINITPRLGFNRSLPDPEATIEATRARWAAWFEAAPPVLDEYRQQYTYAWWVMGAGLLNSRYFFTRQAMTPSKIHYVGVWLWDQFFHAIAYRHVDARLAEDQIRIMLDHQREDGMLPDAVFDEGMITHLTFPVEADVTKPPLAAWAVLKLYDRSGHLDFLQEVYQPLCRCHAWWLEQRASVNGLCEYRHPFSSGLDDSPLWDDGMPVVAPDLNTYLCLQAESLARIADLIGLSEDAVHFRAQADQMAQRMLATLWSEADGAFMAQHDGKPVDVMTPFSLLPLWTGRLPEPVIERLIGHLTNPESFWTTWPLPTVAANDPKFDPQQMWRGPTWVNINYMFVEALERVGRAELARSLRRKTLDLIKLHDDIFEYYNPLTGDHPPKAAPIFGWTSAVYIDLAIQETAAARRDEGRSSS
ncbi:MAG: hypothetical protein IT320_11825 [Anaerolineae bacterium]|nr:hypothetical protein [Anaerolineae bacterium]